MMILPVRLSQSSPEIVHVALKLSNNGILGSKKTIQVMLVRESERTTQTEEHAHHTHRTEGHTHTTHIGQRDTHTTHIGQRNTHTPQRDTSESEIRGYAYTVQWNLDYPPWLRVGITEMSFVSREFATYTQNISLNTDMNYCAKYRWGEGSQHIFRLVDRWLASFELVHVWHL